MFSKLRPTLLYKDVSPDISSHDNDLEGELWSYDDRDVYRGSFDPMYSKDGLNVYSLYDDNLKRVGVAEHESDEPEVFMTLWFRENSFATLFQNDEWVSKESTLWSLLSNEAYQDLLNSDFKNVDDEFLKQGILLMRPQTFYEGISIYECERCGKKSFSALSGCDAAKKVVDPNHYSILFLDDSFLLFDKPVDFTLPAQSGACEPERSEQVPLCSDPPESRDAEPPPPHASPPAESPPPPPQEQPQT
jgi:hypothetical protein